MTYLPDTSVLVRMVTAADASHAAAVRAVAELHRRGEKVVVTPQVMIEFRNVATRPTAVNGLGLSAADARTEAAAFQVMFPLLPETPDIYPAWQAIVESLGVVGKQVHDARLVAVCQVHRVSAILTFNVGHFARLGGVSPAVAAVDPATV